MMAFMQNSLKVLRQLQGLMPRVERVLSRQAHASDPLTQRMSRHAFAGRGKRVRPGLLLLTYQAARGSRANGLPSSLIHLAAMIEMIHTASVIHDDIIDESLLRRGQDTLHRKWGSKTAMLMGDFLYARSAMLIARHGNMEVLDVVSRSVSEMCQGQMLELANAYNIGLSRKDYLRIIRGKTGALFAAACETGVIMSGKWRLRQAASAYGLQLGLAFQVMDDILDLTASEEQLGKPVGWDLREGRITLPFILALEAAGGAERRALQSLARHDVEGLVVRGADLARRLGGIEAAIPALALPNRHGRHRSDGFGTHLLMN